MIRVNVSKARNARSLLHKRALTCARNTIFASSSLWIQSQPSFCAYLQFGRLARRFADVPHSDMEENQFVRLADSALEEIFDSMGDVEDAIDDADITLSVRFQSV